MPHDSQPQHDSHGDDQLRQRVRLLEQILDSIPEFVFAKNADYRFTFVNKAFADAFAKGSKDLDGKTEEDFYDAVLAEKFRNDDIEVLRTGVESQYRELFNEADKQRVLETHKFPLLDPSRNVTGVVGIYSDITDQVEVLEELRQKERRLREAEVQLSLLGAASTPNSSRPPNVFISYKHGDASHDEWVRRFATDLIERHGIDCLLDQFDLDYGDSIQGYMHRIQTEATHVLFVISSECVKAVERNTGGVAFELQLAAALRDKKQLKLIPVLREGKETPSYVRSHLYIDFRDDDLYLDMMKRLADSILQNRPRPHSRAPSRHEEDTGG